MFACFNRTSFYSSFSCLNEGKCKYEKTHIKYGKKDFCNYIYKCKIMDGQITKKELT